MGRRGSSRLVMCRGVGERAAMDEAGGRLMLRLGGLHVAWHSGEGHPRRGHDKGTLVLLAEVAAAWGGSTRLLFKGVAEGLSLKMLGLGMVEPAKWGGAHTARKGWPWCSVSEVLGKEVCVDGGPGSCEEGDGEMIMEGD